MRSVPYEIVRHMGEAELRRYGDLVMVTVYDLDEVEASGLLSKYMKGENDTGTAIPMTAPIVTRTSNPAEHEWGLSFLLPDDMVLENVPKPDDPRIIVERKRGGLFAAIRFRGPGGGGDMQRMTNELTTELTEADLRMDGRPFLLQYNSRLTPGFTRRNEVAVRVMPVTVPGNE